VAAAAAQLMEPGVGPAAPGGAAAGLVAGHMRFVLLLRRPLASSAGPCGPLLLAFTVACTGCACVTIAGARGPKKGRDWSNIDVGSAVGQAAVMLGMPPEVKGPDADMGRCCICCCCTAQLLARGATQPAAAAPGTAEPAMLAAAAPATAAVTSPGPWVVMVHSAMGRGTWLTGACATWRMALTAAATGDGRSSWPCERLNSCWMECSCCRPPAAAAAAGEGGGGAAASAGVSISMACAAGSAAATAGPLPDSPGAADTTVAPAAALGTCGIDASCSCAEAAAALLMCCMLLAHPPASGSTSCCSGECAVRCFLLGVCSAADEGPASGAAPSPTAAASVDGPPGRGDGLLASSRPRLAYTWPVALSDGDKSPPSAPEEPAAAVVGDPPAGQANPATAPLLAGLVPEMMPAPTASADPAPVAAGVWTACCVCIGGYKLPAVLASGATAAAEAFEPGAAGPGLSNRCMSPPADSADKDVPCGGCGKVPAQLPRSTGHLVLAGCASAAAVLLVLALKAAACACCCRVRSVL
jgi:hypothetical protein